MAIVVLDVRHSLVTTISQVGNVMINVQPLNLLILYRCVRVVLLIVMVV